MIILAFDPGGTTGIAIYADYGEHLTVETLTKTARETPEWLDHFGVVDVVIVERFATAGLLSKYGLETIDLVGQIKGWCLARKIQCVVQSPQSRKAWLNDAEFFDKKKRVIHEIDALSHLLQYLETVTGSRPSAVRESLH